MGAEDVVGRHADEDELATDDGDAPDASSVEDERAAADAAALERFRAGDADAYGELFARYRRVAVGYARRFTNSSPDAEDLAQDAFARVLQALRRGKGPTVSMRHYLLTAVRTIATDGFRRKVPKEYPTDPEVLTSLYEQEHFEDEHEYADWVVEGFNALSHRQQSLVWNHAVEGRSLTSIAPDLQISVASASRDYSKAMKSMRGCFARAAALTSGDPACAEFSDALGAPHADRSDAARAHLACCGSCRAVARRLHAKDNTLMSLVVVSGLGTLGIQSLRAESGAAAAAVGWSSGLPTAVKAVGGALLLAAAAATVALVVALSGGSNDVEATAVPPLGSAAADGSVIVSTDGCELRREVVGERREVWQLSGGAACDVTVSRSADGNVDERLLDTRGERSARGLEIVRAGEYAVQLWEGRETTRVSLRIERAAADTDAPAGSAEPADPDGTRRADELISEN